jgi:hypothetical protein
MSRERTVAVHLSEADLAHLVTALERDVLAEDSDLSALGLSQVHELHVRLSALWGMAYGSAH